MMGPYNMFPAVMSAFGLLFFLLLFVLFAIWILLPFSIFGIKDLIREAIEEQKKTNELLRNLLKEKDRNEESEKRKEETENRK